MAQNREPKQILAIECAVGRGSVAILTGNRVIASTDGLEADPSRAEQILGVVKKLAQEANVSLRELDLVAASTGPGSYSGIRIGLATALGLKNALDIQCVGVPVLEAMALSRGGSGEDLIVAIPVGKKDVAWKVYRAGEVRPTGGSTTELTSATDFSAKLRQFAGFTLFCHSDLPARVDADALANVVVVDAGTGLARLVGLAAGSGHGGSELRPIYLRNQSHAAGPAGI